MDRNGYSSNDTIESTAGNETGILSTTNLAAPSKNIEVLIIYYYKREHFKDNQCVWISVRGFNALCFGVLVVRISKFECGCLHSHVFAAVSNLIDSPRRPPSFVVHLSSSFAVRLFSSLRPFSRSSIWSHHSSFSHPSIHADPTAINLSSEFLHPLFLFQISLTLSFLSRSLSSV